MITGCLRSTPTKALYAMLHLLPPDKMGKCIALKAAIRMNATLKWQSNYGHSEILREFDILTNIVYFTSQLTVTPGFECTIPSRLEWVECQLEPDAALKIYTDGSKLDGRVGFGGYVPELAMNIMHRIPDH